MRVGEDILGYIENECGEAIRYNGLMDKKIEKILKRLKGKRIGLFIDNANWFYPQRELGWDIDYEKLSKFLSKFFKLKVLNLYTGTPLGLVQKRSFESFADKVKKYGFKVETKPLKKIWVDRKRKEFIYKCNFDVEIALDVARTIDKLDLVAIGSGDSDFLAIRNYCFEKGKGFLALCFEQGVSWEIRKGYHVFLEDIKAEIVEKKPRRKRGDNNRNIVSSTGRKSRSR